MIQVGSIKFCPNLGKESGTQVQDAQRASKRMMPKISTPRYIIIELHKLKTKIKYGKQQEKTACHIQGKPHKSISRYFSRNFTGQKEQHYIFKVLKGSKQTNSQSKILYPARLIFRIEEGIKSI